MKVGQEKEVATILMHKYHQQGWVLFQEFGIPGSLLLLSNSSHLRPDIFALRAGESMVIEVENVPFVHHSTSYRELANYCYLAYPKTSEQDISPKTMLEQIVYAKNQGIGILQVNTQQNGAAQVKEIYPAMKRELRPEIKSRLIHLAYKRYIREQTQLARLETEFLELQRIQQKID